MWRCRRKYFILKLTTYIGSLLCCNVLQRWHCNPWSWDLIWARSFLHKCKILYAPRYVGNFTPKYKILPGHENLLAYICELLYDILYLVTELDAEVWNVLLWCKTGWEEQTPWLLTTPCTTGTQYIHIYGFRTGWPDWVMFTWVVYWKLQ
jgi:hypothetical protein